MLDMNTPLGRNVPTATQVLNIIRPELRMIRAVAAGLAVSMRQGWIEGDDDLNVTDEGDASAETAVFAALRGNAMDSVILWARENGMVFDKDAVAEFIRTALICSGAGDGHLPAGALDY